MRLSSGEFEVKRPNPDNALLSRCWARVIARSNRFAATGILPKFNEKLVAAGIHLPVELFDEVVMVEPA